MPRFLPTSILRDMERLLFDWPPENAKRCCTQCSKTNGWVLFGVSVADGNEFGYECRRCNLEWCWDCGKHMESVLKSTREKAANLLLGEKGGATGGEAPTTSTGCSGIT